MFWFFLIFLIPAVLYAISFFKLTQTPPDASTANYAYYAAVALQLIFTGYVVFHGAGVTDSEKPKSMPQFLPQSMPQMSMR